MANKRARDIVDEYLSIPDDTQSDTIENERIKRHFAEPTSSSCSSLPQLPYLPSLPSLLTLTPLMTTGSRSTNETQQKGYEEDICPSLRPLSSFSPDHFQSMSYQQMLNSRMSTLPTIPEQVFTSPLFQQDSINWYKKQTKIEEKEQKEQKKEKKEKKEIKGEIDPGLYKALDYIEKGLNSEIKLPDGQQLKLKEGGGRHLAYFLIGAGYKPKSDSKILIKPRTSLDPELSQFAMSWSELGEPQGMDSLKLGREVIELAEKYAQATQATQATYITQISKASKTSKPLYTTHNYPFNSQFETPCNPFNSHSSS